MKVAYLRYLRSDAWLKKRHLVLERDGYRCQLWHRHVATEVHHRTYEHLGHEPLEDLLSLCRTGHAAITVVLRRERHRARRLRLCQWER
jgi:5-methylcytosine-specific restriction endonuclease McrA